MSKKNKAIANGAADLKPVANSEGFIDVAELLRRLPISRRTLDSHRKRGLIPAIELGGRIIFHWDSVKAALLRRQGSNT